MFEQLHVLLMVVDALADGDVLVVAESTLFEFTIVSVFEREGDLLCVVLSEWSCDLDEVLVPDAVRVPSFDVLGDIVVDWLREDLFFVGVVLRVIDDE